MRPTYYGTAVPEPAGAGRAAEPRVELLDEEWCDQAGCPLSECRQCQEALR